MAHASAIPYLEEKNKIKINGGVPHPYGSIAVIGPGTGLGMSFGFFDFEKNKYVFHPSEGGNRIAAGADDKQLSIISKILKKCSFVRWEDLISGQGIKNIYEALFDEIKPTEEIMHGLQKEAKSIEAFDMVCGFLGLFARNVADIFLCSGGIYIIGGIFSRKENLEFLKKSSFMSYYNITLPKGSPYLENYPITVVTEENLALTGLANL